MGIAQVRYVVNIGPMANYGHTQHAAFSTMLSSELSRQSYEYTNCVYDENNKGIVLTPNYYTPAGVLVDMVADSTPLPAHFIVDPATGFWSTCQAKKWAGVHLVMETCLDPVGGSPAITTTATSVIALSSAPDIYFSLLRPSNWAGIGTSYREYFFVSFGMLDPEDNSTGFQLELSGGGNPTLYGPSDPTLGEQPLLSIYDMDESERKDMWSGVDSTWAISNYNGDLFIRSTFLRKTWIIRQIGDIPAGYMQFGAWGGPYAFNLTQTVYATDGNFITDWIDEGDAGEISLGLPYPLTDGYTISTVPGINGSTKTITTMPQGETSVTVTIELYDEQPTPLGVAGDMSRRYKVSLHGDGTAPSGMSFHTPIIRAISLIHRSVMDAKADQVWIDVSGYMMKGSEQLSLDPAASNAEFVFRNPYTTPAGTPHGEFSMMLENLTLAYPEYPANTFYMGQMAISYDIGYAYVDPPNLRYSTRLWGLVRSRTEHDALNEMNYTMRIRDRAAQLEDNDLANAPCLLRFPIDEALALLAEHAGIHPDDIQLCGVISPESIVGSWWTRAPAPINPYLDPYGNPALDPLPTQPRYLLGQMEDFKSPPWLLNGENAWEAMQRIAQRYGYVVEFGSYGGMYIRQSQYRNSTWETCGISTLSGVDQMYSAESVDVEDRIDGKITAVQVEGRDWDGNAITQTLTNISARDNPGTPGYVGYTIMKRVIDQELDSLDAVQNAAQYFLDNNLTGGATTGSPTGSVRRRKVDISSQAASLWYLYPRDLIEVYDDAVNISFGFFRVHSVSSEFTLNKIQSHIEAEEIDPNAAWSWPGYGLKPLYSLMNRAIDRLRPYKPRLSASGSGSANIVWPPVPSIYPYYTPGLFKWFTTSDVPTRASHMGGTDPLRPNGSPHEPPSW